MSNKTISTLYLTLCAVLALVGSWALYQRFASGLRVTHLGSTVPWGLWVGLYIYFVGLSAGSFLLSTLIYVFGVKKFEAIGRLALLQAALCLGLAMAFILIDLGRPERFLTVLYRGNVRSVLAWEIRFYLVYMVLLVAELYYLMRPDLVRLAQRSTGIRQTLYRWLSLGSADLSVAARQRDMAWLRTLGIIGIPVAIGVHGGTGAIFAVVKARPYWYSPLFPIVFLVSALASGGALLMMIKAFTAKRWERADDELLSSLGKLTAGILLFDLMLLGTEFLVGIYGQIPDHLKAYQLIATGPFWWVFWIVQLALGAVVPLGIIFNKRTGASRAWLGTAGLLIVTGIVGVRLNIVIPPLAIPAFPTLPDAYHSARLAATYFPSVNEWLCSVGLIAFGALLFNIASAVLPMEEVVPTAEEEREAVAYRAAARGTAQA